MPDQRDYTIIGTASLISEDWANIIACYSGPIYRDDIYPEARYLERCLRACQAHGAKVYKNFLQTTFLADGITALEAHLSNRPDSH